MPVREFFFDSNILLYTFLDFQDTQKHKVAAGFFSTVSGIISTQVVNEVCSNVIRKANASEDLIDKIIRDLFQKYLVISPAESTLLEVSGLRSRYKFSYWDSIIVASALEANAKILYSEDMQHNLVIENRLTIVNPFLN